MSDKTVDLRSDTITLPTEEMQEAMARAPLGDDVYGEDPTVNRLQELAADKMGKEAALYVPSGTMGNTCALLAHANWGDEALFEEQAHMYYWEAGTYANIAGLAARAVKGEHGVVTPEQIHASVRADNPHFAPLKVVCIENSHNNYAGHAWSVPEMAAVGEACREHGLKLHMDGARIFNAAVAMGVAASDYAQHVDSVMFCVSKGLSAPLGSLVCGDRAFIDEVYRMRKRLGGAMRQAGVVAAAGIVALEQMVERLADDHAVAQALADGLGSIDGVEVLFPPRPTNILKVEFAALGWSAADVVGRWKERGVLCNPRPPHGARLVANRHVGVEDVGYVVEVTREMLGA
jgi:threonine aldolase